METLQKKALFWDTEVVDPRKNSRFVIERILDLGDEKDFRWALDYYGREALIDNLIKSKSLSDKSLLFWCRYFNIDQKKCLKGQSTKKQSAFWKK